jgi:exosortase family protein XrtM
MADKKLSHGKLGLFFNAYRQELRFTFWFLLILAVLNYGYYLLAGTAVESFILTFMTAEPPAIIINILTPAEHVVVDRTQLRSQAVVFSVVSGCEGMGGILLIVSAICAANVPFRAKLKGLFYGVTFIYLVNIARIVGLYYVMRYFISTFNFAHYYVGQTVVILLGCLFFLVWITRNLAQKGAGTPQFCVRAFPGPAQ